MGKWIKIEERKRNLCPKLLCKNNISGHCYNNLTLDGVKCENIVKYNIETNPYKRK